MKQGQSIGMLNDFKTIASNIRNRQESKQNIKKLIELVSYDIQKWSNYFKIKLGIDI